MGNKVLSFTFNFLPFCALEKTGEIWQNVKVGFNREYHFDLSLAYILLWESGADFTKGLKSRF